MYVRFIGPQGEIKESVSFHLAGEKAESVSSCQRRTITVVSHLAGEKAESVSSWSWMCGCQCPPRGAFRLGPESDQQHHPSRTQKRPISKTRPEAHLSLPRQGRHVNLSLPGEEENETYLSPPPTSGIHQLQCPPGGPKSERHGPSHPPGGRNKKSVSSSLLGGRHESYCSFPPWEGVKKRK